MAVQNLKKLNRLEREIPEGLIVDASWMEERGYSRSLRSQYVAAGWLEQPARGVFRRARGSLQWEEVVISLQTLLRLPVSVGGRTALELQGYAHYLSYSQPAVHLYSDKKLPGWLDKLPVEPKFIHHNRTRFLPEFPSTYETLHPSRDKDSDMDAALPGELRALRWGQWSWPLLVSTPERAILELLDELPDQETFHHADVLMEGLANLSPRRLQSLLEPARSVKVKRLFFFFADRHRHAWLKRLDRGAIDLGKGKRMLVKGGKLDRKYQITVPEDMHAVQ